MEAEPKPLIEIVKENIEVSKDFLAWNFFRVARLKERQLYEFLHPTWVEYWDKLYEKDKNLCNPLYFHVGRYKAEISGYEPIIKALYEKLLTYPFEPPQKAKRKNSVTNSERVCPVCHNPTHGAFCPAHIKEIQKRVTRVSGHYSLLPQYRFLLSQTGYAYTAPTGQDGIVKGSLRYAPDAVKQQFGGPSGLQWWLSL